MDQFDRYCEALVLEIILAIMPKQIASLRELKIQNLKLKRMVIAPRDSRTAFDMLAGKVSLKKWKKGEEKRAREVAEQARKVRSLSTICFKDFLRRDKPQLTNAQYQVWRKSFDQATKEGAEKMKAQARQLPPRKPAAALKRAGFHGVRRISSGS